MLRSMPCIMPCMIISVVARSTSEIPDGGIASAGSHCGLELSGECEFNSFIASITGR